MLTDFLLLSRRKTNRSLSLSQDFYLPLPSPPSNQEPSPIVSKKMLVLFCFMGVDDFKYDASWQNFTTNDCN